MDRLLPSWVWTMRIVYLALALAILFCHLLPLQTVPRQWAPPDLIVAFTFAWVMRRPDYVPSVAIGLVLLVADLLLQRPPGLLAALVVAGSAYLKGRATGQHEGSFAGEWLTVGVVIAMTGVLYRTILWLTSVPVAPLHLTVSQVLLTILVYPLVVGISQALLGVKRLTPSEIEAKGATT